MKKRNTPAYAGKTSRGERFFSSVKKHPRLRGEDFRMRLKETLEGLETPPLTRGRRGAMPISAHRLRNTPAYAGKTCGSKAQGRDLAETPPLTRGRRGVSSEASGERGNTPAYAGKTPVMGMVAVMVWKHPRLRGEDWVSWLKRPGLAETPPLTRGRRSRTTRLRDVRRNTPAYAGKTPCRRSLQSPRRKHPRLRGEDSFRGESVPCLPETPPLTRGRLGARRAKRAP